MNFRVAVPPFNCAVPTMATSSHRGADASQNLTVPAVTGAPPAVTEAARVTAVGETTDGEESTSVVTVETAAACAVGGTVVANTSRADKSSLEFRLIQESSEAVTKTCHHLGSGKRKRGRTDTKQVTAIKTKLHM